MTWEQIYDAISSEVNRLAPPEAIQATVTKVDKTNMVIFCAEEFGDQPIPLFAMPAQVAVYDSTTSGATPAAGAALPVVVNKKIRPVEYLPPKVGDSVLVMRQFGEQRLPKCVGVLLSTNFVVE